MQVVELDPSVAETEVFATLMRRRRIGSDIFLIPDRKLAMGIAVGVEQCHQGCQPGMRKMSLPTLLLLISVAKTSISATLGSSSTTCIALHGRSCHQSPEVLIRALESDSPSWIRADITAQEIREVASKYTCVPSALAKRRGELNLLFPIFLTLMVSLAVLI